MPPVPPLWEVLGLPRLCGSETPAGRGGPVESPATIQALLPLGRGELRPAMGVLCQSLARTPG